MSVGERQFKLVNQIRSQVNQIQKTGISSSENHPERDFPPYHKTSKKRNYEIQK
jgi:hypothetical protein